MTARIQTLHNISNIEDTIKACKSASSFNSKKQILLHCNNQEALKYLLFYAFNPYTHFRITKVQLIKTSSTESLQTNNIWISALEEITKISSTHQRRRSVHALLHEYCPESQELLIEVITKKLRIGLGATKLNQIYPGLIPVFGVMKAYSYKHYEHLYDSWWYVSLKYDGVRGVFQEGKMFSRKGLELPGLNEVKQTLSKYPKYTFDGELIIPGVSFQEGSGLIRKGQGDPIYYIFDIIDESMPFKQRYETLLSLESMSEQIKIIKHKTNVHQNQLPKIFEQALSLGYEGLILKSPNHRYVRRRSNSWLKVKPVSTIKLPIIGLQEGQGKYKGMLGAFLVVYKGTTVSVGTGITDAQRQEFWDNRDLLVNKIIELAFMEKTPTGSLRHPVYRKVL